MLIVLVLVAFAVPLGLSLRQIAWEALASRDASSAIAAAFPSDARVNDLKIDYDARAAAASRASAGKAAARVAERLALVAGVPPGNVLVDRVARKAVVRAAPLSGADMSAYRALEERVAASESGWTVTLVPPVVALPRVPLVDGTADEAAMQTVIWAGQRLQLPIGVSAETRSATSAVVEELKAAGLQARAVPGHSEPGYVSLGWLGPEDAPATP